MDLVEIVRQNLNPTEVMQIIRNPRQFRNMLDTVISTFSPEYDVHRVVNQFIDHTRTVQELQETWGRPIRVEPIYIGSEGEEFFVGFTVTYPIPQQCCVLLRDNGCSDQTQRDAFAHARALLPSIDGVLLPSDPVVLVNGPTSRNAILNNGIAFSGRSTIPEIKGSLSFYADGRFSIDLPGTLPHRERVIGLGVSLAVEAVPEAIPLRHVEAVLLAEQLAAANGFLSSTRSWCGFLSIGEAGDVTYHEVRVAMPLVRAANEMFFADAHRDNRMAWLLMPLLHWAKRINGTRRFAALEMTVSAKPRFVRREEIGGGSLGKPAAFVFYD